jgi:hypothetical protein
MTQALNAHMNNKTILKNTLHKKGLTEWLKAKALSSKPSTTKKRHHQTCALLISKFFSAVKLTTLTTMAAMVAHVLSVHMGG